MPLASLRRDAPSVRFKGVETQYGWRKRNKKYNTPGHAHSLTFSCYQRVPLLTNDLWRTWLAEAVRRACDKYEVALWAYVFMPEHVHLLLKPRLADYNMALLEQVLKLSLARRVLNQLKKQRSPLLGRLQVQECGVPGYRFWQAGGGHDVNIWTMKKAVEKAEYCHRNAVTRRLVEAPEKWRWSSFRWLAEGARENEPLAVDDWDETLVSRESDGTGLKQTRPVAPTRSQGAHEGPT